MVNFCVDDLDTLLPALAAKGITCVGEPLAEGYGKFGCNIDCGGRRIELLEPKTPVWSILR